MSGLWESSSVIPIPKKRLPSHNNDYRPVALTSLVMKCLKTIRLHGNITVSRSSSACLQAKYDYRRCLSHTCSPCSEIHGYTHKNRILYLVFSSAFNTTQPHTLPQKLIAMLVNLSFCHVDLGLSYRQKTVG